MSAAQWETFLEEQDAAQARYIIDNSGYFEASKWASAGALFGAMGMTRELPLHLMATRLRTMRIFDGPTEVHKWVVARNLLGTRK